VDLQIVVPLGTAEEVVNAELQAMRDRFPDPRVRTRFTWDCTAVRLKRNKFDVEDELCVNPWVSVSVQSDGTVVSCCYAWGTTPENVYGNLNGATLSEIWNGDSANSMRSNMRQGKAGGLCPTCYLRSPFFIHLGFVPTFLQRQGR
jgi:radical SAM protein with 4Fe4S-binding SPASM domain